MFSGSTLIAKNSGANRDKNSLKLICFSFLWKFF